MASSTILKYSVAVLLLSTHWFAQLPVVTRLYVTSCFLVTAACALEVRLISVLIDEREVLVIMERKEADGATIEAIDHALS